MKTFTSEGKVETNRIKGDELNESKKYEFTLERRPNRVENSEGKSKAPNVFCITAAMDHVYGEHKFSVERATEIHTLTIRLCDIVKCPPDDIANSSDKNNAKRKKAVKKEIKKFLKKFQEHYASIYCRNECWGG